MCVSKHTLVVIRPLFVVCISLPGWANGPPPPSIPRPKALDFPHQPPSSSSIWVTCGHPCMHMQHHIAVPPANKKNIEQQNRDGKKRGKKIPPSNRPRAPTRYRHPPPPISFPPLSCRITPTTIKRCRVVAQVRGQKKKGLEGDIGKKKLSPRSACEVCIGTRAAQPCMQNKRPSLCAVIMLRAKCSPHNAGYSDLYTPPPLLPSWPTPITQRG